MTISGWIQIALFGVIVILITRPLGGYMTRVFNGERTLPQPDPARRSNVRSTGAAGVDEKEEQHWLTYAVAMLFFSVVGFCDFVLLLQRLQAGICRSILRARPGSSRASPSIPRSASSPTPTGSPTCRRRTMGYLACRWRG